MAYRKIKSCRPNGWWVELGVWEGEPAIDIDPCYVVKETDDEDGAEFDGDLTAAEAHYEDRVKELMDTPNWKRQAEYDEAHGTINGYAPWQYESGEY